MRLYIETEHDQLKSWDILKLRYKIWAEVD